MEELLYLMHILFLVIETLWTCLLKAGALPNTVDRTGSTALHYAAFRGRVTATKLLVNAGADVNLANDVGKTPLMFCIQSAEKVAKVLLKVGANLHPKETVLCSGLYLGGCMEDIIRFRL